VILSASEVGQQKSVMCHAIWSQFH